MEPMVNIQEQFGDRLVVIDHPLVEHKLSVLRDKNTPSNIFREALREIALLEVYEATRTLATSPIDIETPIACAHCQTIKGKEPVIIPILRAGLAMQEAFMDLIPTAQIAHLGMKRDEATHEPYLYYANIPASVAERPVLLVDPMLATGGSLVAAIQACVSTARRISRAWSSWLLLKEYSGHSNLILLSASSQQRSMKV